MQFKDKETKKDIVVKLANASYYEDPTYNENLLRDMRVTYGDHCYTFIESVLRYRITILGKISNEISKNWSEIDYLKSKRN